MIRRTHPASPRGGAATVEFALTLPLLLMFIIGIWELGRIVQVQQIVSNAAREGGRQAAAANLTNDQVITAVREYLKQAGLPAAAADNATITLTNTTSGKDASVSDQLDHFELVVTVNYSDVRWTTLALIAGPTTTISASVDWYSMNDVPVTVDTNIPLQ